MASAYGAAIPGTQADALRRRSASAIASRAGSHALDGRSIGPMTLLCASGRGGAGTTLVSALLAVAAAGDGRRVLLIDADDLVGPHSMLLGVASDHSWQDLRGGKLQPADIAVHISTTLTLVPGGSAKGASSAGHALSSTERKACLRRLSVLADGMDLVVIDCGSRLDSVLAAVTPHSGERLMALSGGNDPVGLASTYALCKAVLARHSALPVDIIVNRQEGAEASRCFDMIDAGMRQFLQHRLQYAGSIPSDPTLEAALHKGMPFPDAAVGSPSAIAAHDVVTQLLADRSNSRSGN